MTIVETLLLVFGVPAIALLLLYVFKLNPKITPIDDAGNRPLDISEPKAAVDAVPETEVVEFDLPAKPLVDMTKKELLQVAADCQIANVKSSMRKSALLKLVSSNFTN